MASKQKVSVSRQVHVFKQGPKGWSGPRPGTVTKVWGPNMCNVSVAMDAGDTGHPPTTQHTSVEVHDAGEGPKNPADGQIWAEWPARVEADKAEGAGGGGGKSKDEK